MPLVSPVWLHRIVVALALLQGSWMAIDGCRALIVGDYFTRRVGPHDGQLGPWARVASAVGINPRSPFMKIAHVVLGVAWLISGTVFALRLPGGAAAVGLCAALSLWYAPIGTAFGLIQLVIVLGRR